MAKVSDSAIRQESNSQSIWFPVPNDIINIIFDLSVQERILGSYIRGGTAAGSFNTEFRGVYIHNKTGMIYCMLATQANLRRLRSLANSNVITQIKSDPNMNGAAKAQALENYADEIASCISVAQAYEYDATNVGDLATLLKRHYKPGAGYVFVRDQSAQTQGGAIRVQSKPTGSFTAQTSPSNPALVEYQVADAEQQSIKNPKSDNPFDEIGKALQAMYTNLANSSLIVNPAPRAPTERPDEGVAHQNGTTVFFEGRDHNRCLPVKVIGQDAEWDTVHSRCRGYHSESTLNGLHTTEGPCHPSASFHPHAYWSNSLFTTPTGILKDPGTAALIIGIALLSTKSKDNTKYVVNYKKSQSVIDNEQIDKDLYG